MIELKLLVIQNGSTIGIRVVYVNAVGLCFLDLKCDKNILFRDL